MAKRALLVGINGYRQQPLRGCVNDVEDVRKFLQRRCGFEQGDIRTLIDDDATTANIKDSLEHWLLAGASANDRLLFHYSGHGSLLPGQDGNIHDVICPVDFDFSELHALSDTQFRTIFEAVPPGACFNWISDSCHSGDLARSWTAAAVRALRLSQTRSRFLAPPPPVMQEIERLRAKNATTRSLSRALEHLSGVLIAGCQSDETAADAVFANRANGALTYFLLQELDGPSGLKDDVHTIVGRVARAAETNGYTQHPQLRGRPELCTKPFLADASEPIPGATISTQDQARGTALSSAALRSPVAKGSKRLAFVVGNADYLQANPLKNAVNDARELARSLNRLQFEVFGRVGGTEESVPFGMNLCREALDASFNHFAAHISPGDTVFIYYAGHGLQVNDENYLVPADARLDGANPLATLVPLRPLIERSAQAAKSSGTVIVFLDSCRENPFSADQLMRLATSARSLASTGSVPGGFEAVDQGFSTVKMRTGDDAARTFIAFATAPGDFAYDGSGDHSPFAAALLEHLGTPGLPLEDCFARVSIDVKDRVRHEGHFQDPWSESNLNQRFYFDPGSWRPVVELGLLGLLAGLLTCLVVFNEQAELSIPADQPWRWGVGLLFGGVVGLGTYRWGSRRWRDVIFSATGTAISFAIAFTILKSHGWAAGQWQHGKYPKFSEIVPLLSDTRIVALSGCAGTLFLIGMLMSRKHEHLHQRGAIWLAAILLGLTSTLGLASLQIYLSDKEPDIVAEIGLLCVMAGVVFAAGTALACKPQGGIFKGYGPAAGAVCVGLLMPVGFGASSFTIGQLPNLPSGFLMSCYGALWFAAFGAQLGYCFSYYVPEHRRWSPP